MPRTASRKPLAKSPLSEVLECKGGHSGAQCGEWVSCDGEQMGSAGESTAGGDPTHE